MAPIGDHATLASIVIPGYQNLDDEALTVNFWEKQKLLIEFKPVKFQKLKDRKGRQIGPGIFLPAKNMRDNTAIGYGAFVSNQDFGKASKIFQQLYSMTPREDMSTYPLSISLSFYPITQSGELHPCILADENWSEDKITKGMKSFWEQSWKQPYNGGGCIPLVIFRNINSLNVNLPVLGGSGKMMTVRKFILSLYDKEWKRNYFAAIAPVCSREGQIMENSVNVHLTVSVCRPERQAQLMCKAIQIVPEIPQLLLKQFGSDNLTQVLDPCILDRVTADGTLPQGIIPPISPFNITLNLEKMEEPTDAPPTEVDSAFKSNALESIGDLSALTTKSQGKYVGSKLSVATGGTTASTRVKLKEEISRNDLLLRISDRIQTQHNQLADYNYQLTDITKSTGDPPEEKLNKIYAILKKLDAINHIIAEMNLWVDPDYKRGPHDMDLSAFGIPWPMTENQAQHSDDSTETRPTGSEKPSKAASASREDSTEHQQKNDVSRDDSAEDDESSSVSNTGEHHEDVEMDDQTQRGDDSDVSEMEEEDNQQGEYQQGELSDTSPVKSAPPSPINDPDEYDAKFPALPGSPSSKEPSASQLKAEALHNQRVLQNSESTGDSLNPPTEPPDYSDPLSASPNAGEGRE